MPATFSRRLLFLRDPASAATPAWQELEQRLPQADRIGDREAAARSLLAAPYDLIVTDTVLPGGGPFGLLGELITRQYNTTVVVHFQLEGGQRWLKLFEHGEFDLNAEPMTSERFFRWLEEWLEAAVPASAHAT